MVVSEIIRHVRIWGFIPWTTGKPRRAVQQHGAILSPEWSTAAREVTPLTRRVRRP